MIKVAWDVEELVALIDVYRKSDGKTTDQIEKELMDLSKSLTLRAQKLGIKYDEKFRNLNGMNVNATLILDHSDTEKVYH